MRCPVPTFDFHLHVSRNIDTHIMSKVLWALLIVWLLADGSGRNMATNHINWHNHARTAWENYRALYIFCGANCDNNSGLVYDPLSGYFAVSEGVGYGLLLATLYDDQATFDTIYNAAQRILYDPETGLHHWRADQQGNIVGYGSATDAELDIAAALIFADRLVRNGQWTPSTDFDYADEARQLLTAIWSHSVVDERFLKPGNLFGEDGQDILNLSYFAPAWFRIYDDFLGTDQWRNLIDTGYQSLYATAGSPLGLAPDWSTFDGQPAYAYCDESGRPRDICGYEMRYDAIRVPWRIGLDCLWFDEPRACEWSQRSVDFLNSLNAPDFARMYDMQGNAVVAYVDEAMLSMWLFAAIASGDTDLQNRLEWQLLNFATSNAGGQFLAGREAYYYNQSLTLFALAYLADGYQQVLQTSP